MAMDRRFFAGRFFLNQNATGAVSSYQKNRSEVNDLISVVVLSSLPAICASHDFEEKIPLL